MENINQNLKLRTDGLYVQFGYRPWNNWMAKTSDCWYNIIKVTEQDEIILLGQFNIEPFFEINPVSHVQMSTSKPNKLNETCCEIKNLHNQLGLVGSNDFDIIQVVKKLREFDWNKLNLFQNKAYVSSHLKYSNDVREVNPDITLTHICNFDESPHANSTIVTYANNTNEFYIKYSHSWTEGDVWAGDDAHFVSGTEQTLHNQIPFKILTNSFKFTFVPDNLDEKSIWIDEYIKWKERYEYHNFYSQK